MIEKERHTTIHNAPLFFYNNIMSQSGSKAEYLRSLTRNGVINCKEKYTVAYNEIKKLLKEDKLDDELVNWAVRVATYPFKLPLGVYEIDVYLDEWTHEELSVSKEFLGLKSKGDCIKYFWCQDTTNSLKSSERCRREAEYALKEYDSYMEIRAELIINVLKRRFPPSSSQ